MQTYPQAELSPSAIDRTIEAALACAALHCIRTEQDVIIDHGIPFLVRWISSLARKDETKVSAAGRRDPDFNPFLPPEPTLTLGSVGDAHLIVLNKFPVITRHLLIITRAFEDQHTPLTPGDFDALAAVMAHLGGLGFYNGGTEAGASQRHKHLQWIPETSDGPGLARFTHGLTKSGHASGLYRHPAVPWRHAFVRVAPDAATESAFTASITPPILAPSLTPNGARLHTAFLEACAHLGIAPDTNPMPPYNLLVDRHWMLVLPRCRERHLDISINALGFAGSLFVPRPEQIDLVRSIGPLQLLAEVTERYCG